MIPYDDLVVALTAWRERQGLPVAKAVVAAPPSPPARGHAAPAAPSRPAAPPAPADPGDFEDGALIEDAGYDAASDDYVMQLGEVTVEQAGEATAIGAAPESPPHARRGKRPDGW